MNHIRYTTVTEYPKFPPASIKHASIKEYISLEQIAVKFEVPTELSNTGILPSTNVHIYSIC